MKSTWLHNIPNMRGKRTWLWRVGKYIEAIVVDRRDQENEKQWRRDWTDEQESDEDDYISPEVAMKKETHD